MPLFPAGGLRAKAAPAGKVHGPAPASQFGGARPLQFTPSPSLEHLRQVCDVLVTITVEARGCGSNPGAWLQGRVTPPLL